MLYPVSFYFISIKLPISIFLYMYIMNFLTLTNLESSTNIGQLRIHYHVCFAV